MFSTSRRILVKSFTWSFLTQDSLAVCVVDVVVVKLLVASHSEVVVVVVISLSVGVGSSALVDSSLQVFTGVVASVLALSSVCEGIGVEVESVSLAILTLSKIFLLTINVEDY